MAIDHVDDLEFAPVQVIRASGAAILDDQHAEAFVGKAAPSRTHWSVNAAITSMPMLRRISRRLVPVSAVGRLVMTICRPGGKRPTIWPSARPSAAAGVEAGFLAHDRSGRCP
jgi:hypothetical protein